MRNFLIFVVVLLVAYVGYLILDPVPPLQAPAVATSAAISAPAAGPLPETQLSTMIKGSLVSMNGRPYTFPANASAESIQYYAIYYSAQWCPPCHHFSPLLVDWYTKFKPTHPNFELIFVSEDHDKDSMLSYMDEMLMPWPAVDFDKLSHDGNGTFRGSGIEQYAGSGIPDLVFVDASGKVLSDSFQAGTYVGPEVVVNDINRIIGGSSPIQLAQ